MTLTAVLLSLKILSIYIVPVDAMDRDDQKVATCVAEALTERPSALTITPSKEEADVILTVANAAAFRMHVTGLLTTKDEKFLAMVDHVQKGFNHKLCHQVDGMLEKLAKQLAKGK